MNKGKLVGIIIPVCAEIVIIISWIFFGCFHWGIFAFGNKDLYIHREEAAPEPKTVKQFFNECSKHIPPIYADDVRVSYDQETNFSVRVCHIDESWFNQYVSECNEAGYNIDIYSWSGHYDAKNSEGYKLTLSYTESAGMFDDRGNNVWIDLYLLKD